MASMTGPESPERWTQAVLKLNRLTRNGDLQWVKVSPPSDATIGTEIYQTNHDGQVLQLRRGATIAELFSSIGKVGKREESSNVRLEILGLSGNVLWTFPTVEGMDDLFQTVAYYQSGLGSYLDRLLSEP